MATAVARAMAREAPSPWLLAKEAPAMAAATTAASPAAVNTMALLARMARTSAPIAAPRSTTATMAWAASVAEPSTVEKNDLCAGSVTYRLTPMPSPNWMMSSTAAPMQLPRSAASRRVGAWGNGCCTTSRHPPFRKTMLIEPHTLTIIYKFEKKPATRHDISRKLECDRRSGPSVGLAALPAPPQRPIQAERPGSRRSATAASADPGPQPSRPGADAGTALADPNPHAGGQPQVHAHVITLFRPAGGGPHVTWPLAAAATSLAMASCHGGYPRPGHSEPAAMGASRQPRVRRVPAVGCRATSA